MSGSNPLYSGFGRGLLAAVLGALAVSLMTAMAAQGQSLPLYTVSAADDKIRTVDPVTGTTLSSVTITLAGKTVTGSNGLDRHPTTGVHYVILKLAGQVGRELVTIVPATGVATDIGNTGLAIAGIAFQTGTVVKLHAVVGRGDLTLPDALVSLDLATGAPTVEDARAQIATGGETIGFNPADGQLYHAFGIGAPNTVQMFEKIDPSSLAATNIPLAVDTYFEGRALTHWTGNIFVLADGGNRLFEITTAGKVRLLSTLDHSPKGMVFAGTPPATCPPATNTLFGEAHQGPDGPSVLYQLDSTTGAPTMIGPVGFEAVGAIAFNGAGTLYGVGERQDGTNTNVLLTINPCTAEGTEVRPPPAGSPTGIEGLGFVSASDLSFRHADGKLFAYLLAPPTTVTELATIDTATGLTTLVGQVSSTANPGGGIAFSSTDTLFQADSVNLNTLNAASGAPTLIAPLLFSPPADNAREINGMDFNLTAGTLFGSVNDATTAPAENYLATISSTTGAVTLINSPNQTQGGLDAIAFVPPPQDFTISNTSGTVTVKAGATGQFTIHVVPGVSGFPNSITFTATPVPTATTLSFTPASVTPGITPSDVLLKLVTTAPSVVPPRGVPMRGPWGPVAPLITACALMLLWLVTKHQRPQYQKLAACLPLIALLICAATFAGCSGLPPPLSGGTPAGPYMVDVTGTAGSVTKTITVQLVVQ